MAALTTFSVAAAEQRAGGVVRVYYALTPLAHDPAAANDALNPVNYALVGTGPGLPVEVRSVSEDPRAFDVYLLASISAGTWVIEVAEAVQRPDLSSLVAPLRASFTAVTLPTYESVAPGASNDAALDSFRKNFNPALKGEAWDALVAAFAAGDQVNFDNARRAFDQLFLSTATSVYLTRKAADAGVQKPEGLGLSDEAFGQLAIRIKTGQVTEQALVALLEVFYGVDSVRAHMDTGTGPWALEAGDDLVVLVDERVAATVVFEAADFQSIGAAEPRELAAAITRALRLYGTKAWAVEHLDPQTGLKSCRVYAAGRGLGSGIRCLGGRAQRLLEFPALLATTPGAMPTWDLTYYPLTQRLRFAPDANFDVSLVRIGDYVTSYGSNFTSGNRGTFEVVDTYWAYPGGVLTQWFEVQDAAGSSQAGLLQGAGQDLRAFRPALQGPSTLGRNAVVESVNDRVDIVLPATSQAVRRRLGTAAYLQATTPYGVTHVARDINGLVTVTCAGHPFQTGDFVEMEG